MEWKNCYWFWIGLIVFILFIVLMIVQTSFPEELKEECESACSSYGDYQLERRKVNGEQTIYCNCLDTLGGIMQVEILEEKSI